MEVKKQNQSRCITFSLRDLAILLIVCVLSLPTVGFKVAEWYFVGAPDSYVSRIATEATAVINSAQQAKLSYQKEKRELESQPSLCNTYETIRLLPFPMRQVELHNKDSL